MLTAVSAEMFREQYASVFEGDERWQGLPVPDRRPVRLGGGLHLHPPAAVPRGPLAPSRRRRPKSRGARVLALLGDSITTDHISPAGSIKADSPAGPVPDRAGRRSRATSTRTARAAATTR